jgi:hypothetical protein
MWVAWSICLVFNLLYLNVTQTDAEAPWMEVIGWVVLLTVTACFAVYLKHFFVRQRIWLVLASSSAWMMVLLMLALACMNIYFVDQQFARMVLPANLIGILNFVVPVVMDR